MCVCVCASVCTHVRARVCVHHTYTDVYIADVKKRAQGCELTWSRSGSDILSNMQSRQGTMAVIL